MTDQDDKLIGDCFGGKIPRQGCLADAGFATEDYQPAATLARSAQISTQNSLLVRATNESGYATCYD
jgi:hypothetical protein